MNKKVHQREQWPRFGGPDFAGGPISKAGFTLIELLFVVLIIAILAALLLPALAKVRARSRQIECLSQLKQIGLCFHAFAHDHQDGFPFQVPAIQGGTLELTQEGEKTRDEMGLTFAHFQTLSNDLDTPRIFACSSDSRAPAAVFCALRNINLSYFAGVTATYQQPDSILSGDRNLITEDGVTKPILRFGHGTGGLWTRDVHEYQGNLLLADGHVDRANHSRLKQDLDKNGVWVSAWIPIGIGPPAPAFISSPSPPPPPSPPAPSSSSLSSPNSGGNSPSSSGAKNKTPDTKSAFTLWQSYFQTPNSPNNPGTPPPETPSSPPASQRPPTPGQPPAAAPVLPSDASEPAAAKPATNRMARRPPSSTGSVSNLTIEPAAAGPSEEPPASFLMVITKPERCWYCWVMILVVAIGTAILLGIEVRRKRRQRRAAALLDG